jgi:hypothetical protein
MAVQTLESPAVEPTLRSISAQAMTYVIPTAITVMVAVCRKMFRRLLGERKPWSRRRTAKKAKTTTNPM